MVSGEKRNCEEENGLEKITTILLDIEGTTTSISFVKDTLFPYVKANLETYVTAHWNDDEFKADVKILKSQAEKDAEEKIENFCSIEEGENEKETLIKNVLWQMDLDRKTTALKQLQGHIWREGYDSGKIKGHVYGEVPEVLKKWSEDGRKLYIYSSGSVEAQKLLFKNTESGDLSQYLSGYFDTETGPKTEASSYTSIAKAVGCDPGHILFLTDVFKEAVAADKAGLHVMIVIREGNTPLADNEKKAFVTLSDLKDLVFESSSKKKKISEESDQGRKSSEKPENVDEAEESKEMKNGDAEKMDTEITESQQSAEVCDNEAETKTEENGGNPTEKENMNTGTPQKESEAIDMDVEESRATGEGSEEKEKAAGDTEEKVEEVESEEKAVTKSSDEVKNKKGDDAKKEEKEEKSVNGHENGENKNGEEKEADPVIPSGYVEESKNGNANGKAEEAEAVEATEGVTVKKVATADEPAESTVEVTA